MFGDLKKIARESRQAMEYATQNDLNLMRIVTRYDQEHNPIEDNTYIKKRVQDCNTVITTLSESIGKLEINTLPRSPLTKRRMKWKKELETYKSFRTQVINARDCEMGRL